MTTIKQNAIAARAAQQFDGLVGAITMAYHLPYQSLSNNGKVFTFGITEKPSQSYQLALDSETQSITFSARGMAIEKFLAIYFWHYKQTTPTEFFMQHSDLSDAEAAELKASYNQDANAWIEKTLGLPVNIDLFGKANGIDNEQLTFRLDDVNEQAVHVISTLLQYSSMKPKVAPRHYAL